ncbi:MAG: DUF2628 domain-containing protein, partial [Gammaproteobacteria bacterium]
RMKVFTVHEPQAGTGDRIERAERVQFVADGFDSGAAVFAPLVLLSRGLYEGLAAYVAVIGLITLAAQNAGLGIAAAITALIALHLIVGFEIGELERFQLTQLGWRDLGLVSGRSRETCEREFFERWLGGQPVMAGIGGMGGEATGDKASPVWPKYPISSVVAARLQRIVRRRGW